MLKKREFILTLLSFTIPYAAFASSMPEWVYFINEEVTSATIALDQSTQESESNSCVEEDFYLRRFMMRVRAKVGIQIPVLAKFEVIPELELLWERPLPEGWRPYHPVQ